MFIKTLQTMETANEDFAPADVDAVMTMLTPGDVLRQDIDTSDEVESLRNRYFSFLTYSHMQKVDVSFSLMFFCVQKFILKNKNEQQDPWWVSVIEKYTLICTTAHSVHFLKLFFQSSCN